ncbi:aminoglycoside phosphotransferase family protein [Psychrobacillus sp. FJAT-51614]|uniref:Aminoglycoside phosphotransferase family protein n=1 Tax=Psychrobacillus mangrovi TaxID=3117745 RepID=A0ABU8F736_9BACI
MKDIIPILEDRIKLLHNATRVEPLSKGYSPDKKYVVVDNYGKKYVLRIIVLDGYERKKEEFQILRDIEEYKVQAPKPVDIGVLEDLGICYNIYSYMEGKDVKESIPSLTEQEQYEIGIEAGRDLARIHLHPAPSTIKPWYERAVQKHYRYLDAYKNCGIKIEHDDKIMDFIESNAHYLKNRPNQFQHDDFHIENIILKDKKYVGVIDFNNYDWGDPFHDFVKVAMSSRVDSIPFSVGQIHGYFDHQIPEEFWRLYSIYVAMVVFSSVVWSIKKSPEQLDKMIERIYVMLEDHKNFELLTPTWYKSKM